VASKGRPYRTVMVEGFEVLVGKSDEENDVLSFQVAAPEDFWLHVAGGVPGSHVVVRNPEKLEALPPAVLDHAAALAVWHSKARGRRRVEVHVCRAADVGKRKGAPAGEVVLRRWSRVRPNRLLADEPPPAD
jgi:predicted ribosome quality control (RQC) complex YloA/Tae2 family protein